MTVGEAKAKTKELERFIALGECNNDDKIFLLSTEEYEEYKSVIPRLRCWWWLRSPGHYSLYVAYVDHGGSVNTFGDDVSNDDIVVRPALRLSNEHRVIGERIIKYDFPWIIISENLAIAEVPVGFERFDGKSNNYAKSHIRQWLNDWMEDRR